MLLASCGSQAPVKAPKVVQDQSTEASLPSTLGPSLEPTAGQLGTKLEWFEIPGRSEKFHLLQGSRDGYLILTPNECFFPELGLTAAGDGMVPDMENLNGGKSFGHVEGWDPGEATQWGVWVDQPGEAVLRVRMSGSSAGGEFEINVGGHQKTFTAPAGDGAAPTLATEFTCRLEDRGLHEIRITNREQPGDDTKLHWVELAGPAIEGASVLRKRWRPAAAHTRFSTPKATDGVRMWIMEMDAVPGELGFYAPITTPFGYYGPSWNADGTVKSGMNFSLWSYGRGQKEPPVKELSHLLAIGNQAAKFSGFGHEGTGVKIRGWEPLAGRQGQRQAFALRVEPGKDYDTYYSYFYATDESRWRLFGAGRKKPKRKPVAHLWVGSFVEVPGPPQRQRTGSTVRRMRYRGWVSKTGKEWLPLDIMSNGDVNKETGLTYTDRGLDPDGWFFMQTGGWTYRKAPTNDVTGGGHFEKTPDYLLPQATKALLTVPSAITVNKATRNGQSIQLQYQIQNLGKAPKVTAYFGTKEGLTLSEKWPQKTGLPNPTGESNSATIKIGSSRPTQIRLLLQNSHGQFWTTETTVVR